MFFFLISIPACSNNSVKISALTAIPAVDDFFRGTFVKISTVLYVPFQQIHFLICPLKSKCFRFRTLSFQIIQCLLSMRRTQSRDGRFARGEFGFLGFAVIPLIRSGSFTFDLFRLLQNTPGGRDDAIFID